MSFDTLGLSDRVLEAVAAAGYVVPTPIQSQAIPPILAGKDVIGNAQTGTGKTASFTLPMLSRLERGRSRARMPRSLVLVPTRELASQVEANLKIYGKNHSFLVALLIGGVSFNDQYRKLDRGADVLIATPGRLLDHFERGKLLLTGVEIFVVDEADRMLDMGFIPDVERICMLLPRNRQSLFFSATISSEIQKLTDRFTRFPVRISVEPGQLTAPTVDQYLVAAPRSPAGKRQLLREVLSDIKDIENAIVFCNRKRTATELCTSLKRHGFSVDSLHGDMDQSARISSLNRFRGGEISYLIASDVAARGLDLPRVSHVFNFDVPIHPEDYVHRIGRTGRAGRSGMSVTLATDGDETYLDRIKSLIRESIPYFDQFSSRTGSKSEEPRTRSSQRPARASRDTGHQKPATSQPKVQSPGRPSRKSEKPGHSSGGQKTEVSVAATPSSKPTIIERHKSENRSARREMKSTRGLGDHVPAFILTPGKKPAGKAKSNPKHPELPQ